MNVIGPDVSFWQDDPTTARAIDFNVMRQAGVGFVNIRAGQNLWNDTKFALNWKLAKAAGLPRGSYWFYDSRADPKRQAEKYIETLAGDLGELPLWCDFEDRYGGNFGTWKDWYNFMERLKQLAPNKKLGVYTGYYYWIEFTSIAPKESKDYFAQYPLWVARYNATEPLIPYPWKDWTLWQYTDNGDGKLYGVESGNIDLNYFNGSVEDLKRVFELSDMPTLPEENQMTTTTYQMKPIANGTRIRKDHNTFALTITSASANDVVVGNELWEAPADGTEVKKGDKWVKVLTVNGVLVAERGWMAYIHKGAPICDEFKTIAGTTPTPDPNPTPVEFYESMDVKVGGSTAVYQLVSVDGVPK